MPNRLKFTISPGKITALWQLILIAEKYNNIKIAAAVKIVLSSGLRGGLLPVKAGLILGGKYGFFKLEKGCIVLTDFTLKILIPRWIGEEPNTEIIRLILSVLLRRTKCSWIVFYSEDIELFKPAIPSNWIELLELGDLLNFQDQTVLDWWKTVITDYKTYRDEKNKQIGEVGEKITKDYEELRLSDDGVENIELTVKWVSKINDSFGFDILSIKGKKYLKSDNFYEPLHIEVKASSKTNEEVFSFFLTKNEWETAKENLDSYYFYCWNKVNVNLVEGIGPYVFSAKKIENEVPIDRGDICKWKECQFVINLNTISEFLPS